VAIYSQIQAGQIAGNAVGKLVALRAALRDVNDLYAWTSSASLADLEAVPPAGPGLIAADATMILTGLADANALWQFYATGLPPASYPQPPSAYVYGASQRAVIGPQSG
jgi:hypothetical protein